MYLNRRQFLLLSVGLVAGCSSTKPGVVSPTREARLINAGTAGDYAADGVYDRFWSLGFFIIRRGNKLFALSSVCTHRRCRLDAEPNHSFSCPCHGSTFDPNGHVTGGLAKRDLPVLATFINEQGNLFVKAPTI